MSADPRIALVEKAFADFEARNVAGIVEFLDPEVESVVAPTLANPGTWQGVEGFVEMTRGWEEPFGVVHYEVREIELVDETNVLVATHQAATGVGSGVPVELDVVFLLEIVAGRAIRFQVHPDRDSALAAI